MSNSSCSILVEIKATDLPKCEWCGVVGVGACWPGGKGCVEARATKGVLEIKDGCDVYIFPKCVICGGGRGCMFQGDGCRCDGADIAGQHKLMAAAKKEEEEEAACECHQFDTCEKCASDPIGEVPCLNCDDMYDPERSKAQYLKGSASNFCCSDCEAAFNKEHEEEEEEEEEEEDEEEEKKWGGGVDCPNECGNVMVVRKERNNWCMDCKTWSYCPECDPEHYQLMFVKGYGYMCSKCFDIRETGDGWDKK